LDRHLSEDDHFANLATTASWHRELSLSHLLVLDAVFYHLQSVSAYSVMGCMSPVSQSVANTLKRALLVWASILYFGNPVTDSGIAGMGMVVLGVFLYNHTRQNHH
jgi:solute carrier family 35 protein E2